MPVSRPSEHFRRNPPVAVEPWLDKRFELAFGSKILSSALFFPALSRIIVQHSFSSLLRLETFLLKKGVDLHVLRKAGVWESAKVAAEAGPRSMRCCD